MNEGPLFVERRGYHQPGAGVWTAEMRLYVPREKWDVLLSSEFPATDLAGSSGAYRATMWVNGFRKSTPPLPFLFCAQKSPETWVQDRSHLTSVLPCPVPGTCLASRRCPIRRLIWLYRYYSPDVPPDPDSRSEQTDRQDICRQVCCADQRVQNSGATSATSSRRRRSRASSTTGATI